MKITFKNTLKTIIPILLGIFFGWYWFQSTSPTDRKQILFYITNANLFWVGISIGLGILGHISRAIRWNFLMAPLGYTPKISNNILIILMAYFANLGFPRAGDILRATALSTYEKVPFEKGFGTIITERVIDVLMLLFIIVITLLLQTEIIMNFLLEKGFNFNGLFLLMGFGLLFIIFFFFVLKKSKNKIALKVKSFLKGLMDGLFSIFKMKNKWAFIFHTFFIWSCYIAMLWVIKYTVPETINLSLSEIMVAFVVGAFAMATTNGGIGIYPIVISHALVIFGISKVSGDAFGWIMWISQTLMVVVFGAISFLLLPLWNRNK